MIGDRIRFPIETFHDGYHRNDSTSQLDVILKDRGEISAELVVGCVDRLMDTFRCCPEGRSCIFDRMLGQTTLIGKVAGLHSVKIVVLLDSVVRNSTSREVPKVSMSNDSTSWSR